MRVLIVTDVCLFRDGLAQVLAGYPDIEVVASTSPNVELPTLLSHCPDVVLLDAATVRASAMVPELLETLPTARVVAFAVAEEDEQEVLGCAEAGVVGFVPRRASVDELVTVLRGAGRGEIRCPPNITALVFRQVARLAAFRTSTHQAELTRRELGIASLIEDGLTNKEIAAKLGIEVSTVKNHVHNILEKVHARRRGELVSRIRSHQSRSRRTATAMPLEI